MAIPGLPFRTLMTRAARRYHNSGLWLPGTKGRLEVAAAEDSTNVGPSGHDDVVEAAPVEISGNLCGRNLSLGTLTRLVSEVGQTTTKDDIKAKIEELRSAIQAQTVTTQVDVNAATETPFDDAGIVEPLDSPSLSSVELPGESEESTEDGQKSVEEKPAPSLADILVNPALSVDNLISKSLGNIFQKKVTKDPVMRSLLDLHGKVDMRELAVELSDFAIEIGASKKPA